jgi:hypothetical protein
MGERMVAYCGIVCTECPAFVATKQDDMEALAKVAEQWSKEFNASLKAEDCICDGCIGEGRKIGHCAECEIRACAIGRGVVNCAHCDDYGCEKLAGFFQFAPNAKATLDEIRLSL